MNIAKTGAAFGLAALTLASSLALGAAAHAAPAPSATPKAPETVTGKLIYDAGTGTQNNFFYMPKSNAESVLNVVGSQTIEKAVAEAAEVHFPAVGQTGEIWMAAKDNPNFRFCFDGIDTHNGGISLLYCQDTPRQNWALLADGTIEYRNAQSDLYGKKLKINSDRGGWWDFALTSGNGSAPRGDYLVTQPTSPTTLGSYGLQAKPDSGTGFKTGTQGTVQFDSQMGTTTSGVDMRTGDKLTWKITLPVGLNANAINPIDVNGFKTSYVQAGNIVTMIVERTGADVTNVFGGNLHTSIPVVATSALVDQAEVKVVFTPNSGYASANATATTKVSVDAGTPIVNLPLKINTPTENQKIVSATGRVDFSGEGRAGSTVELKTKSGTVLKSGIPVGTDGKWSASTWRTVAADYTVTATMTAPGQTTQTKVVHYNLKLTNAVNLPFAITKPTENQKLVDTAGKVVFEGNGTAGATITGTRGNGSAVTPAGGIKVGDDGHWSFTTWLPNSADYTVNFKENGANQKTVHFTLNRSTTVNKPFGIVTPSENQKIANTAGRVEFTGTGTAGATITGIRGNASSVVPGNTSIKVDNDGNWSFVSYLPNTATYTVTFKEDGNNAKVVHFDLDRN